MFGSCYSFLRSRTVLPHRRRVALLLLLPTLLLLAFNSYATGQSKPVTVITSLAPPYTPFLGEYANDITDKLRVTVVPHDSRIESYPVKLVMSLEQVGYGEVMRTSSYATTPVFYIDNGSVTLGGADLASFFLPANIKLSGNTGQMYLNTGRIPDGLYRLGFSVVDAMRQDVILASTGYSAPVWFVLNQPPLPTLPGNDEEVTLTGIQNVRFSWTPRHLGSGNTAFATEYLFQLYEMRVANVGKDQTVLSTAPVYTTTTTSTSLFLTDGDYLLEQGVPYVWRVTADDGIDGFTLFENEGRSETRSFTYGCLCPVPLSPLPYTVTSDKATIEWVPDPLHMEYETRFRLKGDDDGLWHTRESYLGETVIDKVLSPLTSYEYQVRARCFNGEWSDYSPVNWFSTTGITGSAIECGKSDIMAEITNLVPKPMLYAGEVITYGDWQLVLTEVTGGNGIFSGKCTVAVPLFNYARVNMFFDNIRVNELNQVTSGVVLSESSDDSRMIVEDITDYFNEGDQTGNIIDNVAVAEMTLGFGAGDDIRGSISADGTTITVISGDNSQTFTVENLDKGTTVVDNQGNIYAVSDDGTATIIGKDMAASRGEEDHSNISKAITGTSQGTQTGETAAPTGPSPYSAKISFTATGRWAIDERDVSYSGSPFDEEYVKFNGTYVPWKLVPQGKSDKLRVTINNADPDPGQIRFITATGTEFFAKRNGRDYDLEILGGGERDGYELYIVYENETGSLDADAGEEAVGAETESDTEYQVLGKLNVASYPLIERSVIVVPMYGASVNGLKLEDALDAVYSRFGVTWNIKIDYSFDDDSWDTDGNGLNSGNSGFFSAYTSEMRALNSAYVAERGIADNTVYLFWFDSAAGDSEGLAGDMPLDSQFGYIFAATAGTSVYNTVAHELGHGAFQLRHTFSNSYSLPKYSTGNLMDYSGGTQLVKYQWDLLHDPRTMIARWMQDDEDIAMMSAQDICWEKGRENWDPNPPDKYLFSDKLEYDATCTFEYSAGLYRSYFNLTDGNILIVDEVRQTDPEDSNKSEIAYLYNLYIASENEWYEIDIDTFLDDCLSCKINDIATKTILITGKTVGRYLLPIEDLYILISGEDFDGVEAGAAVATAFLLIEFIPGGELVKPVTKGFKSAIKTTVKGSRKVFKIINGAKVVLGEYVDDVLVPAKWIDGEVDEVVEVIQDITYRTSDGREVEGTVQVVKKSDEVGFRLAKFTAKEIDELTQVATKNPESKKVIFGKYIFNSSLSYDEIAKNNNYTFFNLDDWDEIYLSVGRNEEEMWKINKKFIDEQKAVNKEFLFSHNPWEASGETYFQREVEYLIELGAKDFDQIEENLWRVVW